jgi:SAM-dependent methyltransferase
MDKLVKEHLISFYDKLLALHGDSPAALRWTPKGQRARYGVLIEIAEDLGGRKVLDYGCGKGDFYGFLKEKDIRVEYTGLDINPRLISLAQKKYPECRFVVLDIEEEDLVEDFDYIFICGVFNNRVEGAKDAMINTASKLFMHAREGLALTGISSHSPEKDIDINYVLPEEITAFAIKHLTPHVVLRHDYVPYDFTLFLYSRPRGKGFKG